MKVSPTEPELAQQMPTWATHEFSILCMGQGPEFPLKQLCRKDQIL